MIRLLKLLFDWLDNRFPEKIHVTLEMWDALNSDIHDLRDEFNTYKLGIIEHNAKIHGLEESIAAIKEVLAKQTPASISANRRSEFIASGRMGE